MHRAGPSLRAKRSNPSRRKERMDCFAALAMTKNPHTTSPSPRDAPEPLMYLPPNRGRGERRVPVAPAASRALCIGRTHTSKRVHRNRPTFPHAMVLTVSFALLWAVIASKAKRSMPPPREGLLRRGARHRARICATRNDEKTRSNSRLLQELRTQHAMKVQFCD